MVDVPLHVLRSFCVLAEELHFTRAAELLSISAPSLSQQISKLESTIGEKLLERSPRRVVLTEAGVELLPLARRVVADHEEVLVWARGRRDDAGTELLRVGMVAAGAGALTTAILTSAVQRMPAVRFEMRRLGFFDAAEALLAGRVDVVFTPGPIPSDERLDVAPLWSEQRVLVVPRDHALAGRDSVSITETNGLLFVRASGGTPAILDWWLADPRPDGSHPRRGPVADDVEGLLELVAAGVGVNISAASAASHYRRDELAFVPIRDIEPAEILLCSVRGSTTPAVLAFREIAAELAAATARQPAKESP
jgi:DNA-binding transcriptional LysR family regulator